MQSSDIALGPQEVLEYLWLLLLSEPRVEATLTGMLGAP